MTTPCGTLGLGVVDEGPLTVIELIPHTLALVVLERGPRQPGGGGAGRLVLAEELHDPAGLVVGVKRGGLDVGGDVGQHRASPHGHRILGAGELGVLDAGCHRDR